MEDIIAFLEANPHIGEFTETPIDGGRSRMELALNDYLEFVNEFCTYIGKDLKWNSIWKRIKRAGYSMEQDGPKGQARHFVMLSDGSNPTKKKARPAKTATGDKPKKPRKKKKKVSPDDDYESGDIDHVLEQEAVQEAPLNVGEQQKEVEEVEEEEEEEEELDQSLFGSFGVDVKPEVQEALEEDWEQRSRRGLRTAMEGCLYARVFERPITRNPVPRDKGYKAELKPLADDVNEEEENAKSKVQKIKIDGVVYNVASVWSLTNEQDGTKKEISNTNNNVLLQDGLMTSLEKILN